MSKLRVGVIGAGYWGPNLIRNFFGCPLTDIVAVCDANPQRLQSIGSAFPNLRTVASLSELLELKLDAVAIATPVSTHFTLAKQCLEAGLHVMVEKPLAASPWEAARLVQLAKEKGRVLMVDHTYLFSPPVRLIKKIVESGDLGDLYYIDSVRINLGLFQRDINVVWDLAPHDLSIADFVLGAQARSISAWGCSHAEPDIEDIAYVNVDFGDRLMANFHVNWLSPVKVRQIIFAGSRKSIIFNELNITEPVKVYDRGIELGETIDADERQRLLVSYRSGDGWIPHVEAGEALQAAVTHFATCIQDGTTPISDGKLGLRVVRALEAATRSIRAQGGRVILSEGNEDHAYHARNGRHEAVRPHSPGRPAGDEREHPLLREPVRV